MWLGRSQSRIRFSAPGWQLGKSRLPRRPRSALVAWFRRAAQPGGRKRSIRFLSSRGEGLRLRRRTAPGHGSSKIAALEGGGASRRPAAPDVTNGAVHHDAPGSCSEEARTKCKSPEVYVDLIRLSQ